ITIKRVIGQVRREAACQHLLFQVAIRIPGIDGGASVRAYLLRAVAKTVIDVGSGVTVGVFRTQQLVMCVVGERGRAYGIVRRGSTIQRVIGVENLGRGRRRRYRQQVAVIVI